MLRLLCVYLKYLACKCVTETGNEDDVLLVPSDDDFFLNGSSSDDEADDELKDKSARYLPQLLDSFTFPLCLICLSF